jgi:hypothetical protein
MEGAQLFPMRIALVRRVGKANGRYRRYNDFRVKKHRPMVRIIAVENDAPLERRRAATADLPKTGDAGAA